MSRPTPFRPAFFRASALARLDSAERTAAAPPVPALYWLALLALAGLLAAVAGWLIFGRVERLADGRGVIVRDSEFGILEVAGIGGGEIAEVFVREGDVVAAGQPVARFRFAEIQEEIAAVETLLAKSGERTVELELRLRELRIKYDNERVVRAERSGRVVEVVVSVGNVVPPGRTLLRLESLSGPYEALAYVSALEGKKIKTGMTVRVVPANRRAHESGHLLGRVNYVSAYPVTRDYLTSELGGNVRLADFLLEGGSSIEVDIDLLTEPGTGRYQWSSRSGEAPEIGSGLLVEAFVVVEEVRPLTLLFGK